MYPFDIVCGAYINISTTFGHVIPTKYLNPLVQDANATTKIHEFQSAAIVRLRKESQGFYLTKGETSSSSPASSTIPSSPSDSDQPREDWYDSAGSLRRPS